MVAREPVLVEAGAEADSDNNLKLVGTSPSSPEGGVNGDEHLVSPSAVWLFNETQMIDKTRLPEAGASAVSLG